MSRLPRSAIGAFLILIAAAPPAAPQTTGMPSFHAPYRAFLVREFGVTLGFPDGGGTSLEGHYRFGVRAFDIGLQGGFFDPSAGDTRVLAGISARQRVITHARDFPLDGSFVVGIGGQFVEDGSTVVIPGGLSLGRRLNLEDSDVSIVPYIQPTVFLTAGSNQDTDLNVVLGLGADVRMSRVFDARISVGLGDVEGFSVSAVWVR